VKTASVAAVYDRRAFKIKSFGGHRPPLQLARRGFHTANKAPPFRAHILTVFFATKCES
jgi:hypothetical protein